MAERAEVGAVVRERVRAGGLSGSERNALRAACERSGTCLGVRERIEERLATLLAWLHVSSGRPSAGSSPMIWPSWPRVAAGRVSDGIEPPPSLTDCGLRLSRATRVWMRYRPSKTMHRLWACNTA